MLRWMIALTCSAVGSHIAGAASRKGVDAGVAQEYLRQIIGDEGELGERANDTEWRD
jgi:hypothetical protein